MKNINFIILAALILFSACDPIEIRKELGPGITASDIIVNVSGVTPGSNKVIIENKTPGVAGTWDLGILDSKSFKQIDTVQLPYLGVNTFTFTAISDAGVAEVKVDYNVTVMDFPTEPRQTLFAGSTSTGKTWVWAFDNPKVKGKGPWGTGAYLIDKAPTSEGFSTGMSVFEGSQDDEMIFDLNNNSANFTLITHNIGTKGLASGTYVGNFKIDFRVTHQKVSSVDSNTLWSVGDLKLSGASKPTISCGYSPNENNKKIYTFDIISITENELILAYPEKNAIAGGIAWYWVFKPKGFNY
jgi:hypothetical protein